MPSKRNIETIIHQTGILEYGIPWRMCDECVPCPGRGVIYIWHAEMYAREGGKLSGDQNNMAVKSYNVLTIPCAINVEM